MITYVTTNIKAGNNNIWPQPERSRSQPQCFQVIITIIGKCIVISSVKFEIIAVVCVNI